MALSLTTAEERRLASVSNAMLSPLEYQSAGAWCRAMIDQAKALVGADGGGALIPVERRPIMTADAECASREYVHRARPLDERLSFLRRAVQLGAYDRATLFRPYHERYLRSAYYNEWIIPNRFFDTIGLAVATGDDLRVHGVAQLLLHNDRPGARLGARGPALLRLVLPSFRAGVQAWRTHVHRKSALPRVLDRLQEPLMICDAAGRPAHYNSGLERVLAADPEGVRVRAAMEELARSLARFRTGRADPAVPAASVQIATSVECYRIYGTCSEAGDILPGLAILVGLEKTTPDWPSEQDLVRQFRLTPAQARVALLLARGKTNAEIAHELTVSPATARNHTARVREKLDVDTRARVAAVLLGASDRPV